MHFILLVYMFFLCSYLDHELHRLDEPMIAGRNVEFLTFHTLDLCVCVRERERERENI
jgi:hypothetical protein